jgi:hypothetical protein
LDTAAGPMTEYERTDRCVHRMKVYPRESVRGVDLEDATSLAGSHRCGKERRARRAR